MPGYYSNSQTRLSMGSGLLIFSLVLSAIEWLIATLLEDALVIGTALGFALYGLAGYFLYSVNNSFSLFGIGRTTQTALLFLLVSVYPRIYNLGAPHFCTLLVIIMSFFLFRSYERSDTQNHLFWVFFICGVGCIIEPRFLYLAPPFLIGSFYFNTLSLKSLVSSVIGFTLPFWYLLAYGAIQDDWTMPLRIFETAFSFKEIILVPSIGKLTILVFSLISLLAYYVYNLRDNLGKQTRLILNFFSGLAFWALMIMYLQIDTLRMFLPVFFMCLAMLLGYVFQMAPTKASNRGIVWVIITSIVTYIINLWVIL